MNEQRIQAESLNLCGAHGVTIRRMPKARRWMVDRKAVITHILDNRGISARSGVTRPSLLAVHWLCIHASGKDQWTPELASEATLVRKVCRLSTRRIRAEPMSEYKLAVTCSIILRVRLHWTWYTSPREYVGLWVRQSALVSGEHCLRRNAWSVEGIRKYNRDNFGCMATRRVLAIEVGGKGSSFKFLIYPSVADVNRYKYDTTTRSLDTRFFQASAILHEEHNIFGLSF